MTTLEIRNNFHELIDHISNDQLLLKFYDLLNKTQQSKNNALWGRLTPEEQEELLKSELESHDADNLINNTEILPKHKKRL